MNPSGPASPCINVCVLDASQTCTGCGRTIDEIARWGRMGAAEQWQVIERLERARKRNAAAVAVASPGPAVQAT